jgi:hypothetical protein
MVPKSDILAVALALISPALALVFGGPYWGGALLAIGLGLLFVYKRMHHDELAQEKSSLSVVPRDAFDQPDRTEVATSLGNHRSSPLTFDGYGALEGGEVFLPVPLSRTFITAVYVKNSQLSPAKSIHNVRASVEYTLDGQPNFIVESACWWARSRCVGVLNTEIIDLDSNERQALPIYSQCALPLPVSAFFGNLTTRSLGPGRWSLRVTIKADYCEPLTGEIEFTVVKDYPSESIRICTAAPYGAARLPI